MEETENGRDAPANGNAVSIARPALGDGPLLADVPADSFFDVLWEEETFHTAALGCVTPL